MNKYNEIMNGVTVDPEMKRRVMSAVSASIKEQSGSATVTKLQPVRKKASKARTIAIVSSIAAGLLVLLGILGIIPVLFSAKSASETVSAHNTEINSVIVEGIDHACADTESTTKAEADGVFETTARSNDSKTVSGSFPDAATGDKSDNSYFLSTKRVAVTNTKAISNVRIKKIFSVLPFEALKYGEGAGDNGIKSEVFIGKDSDKVAVILNAPEETDLKNEFIDSTDGVVTEKKTASGVTVELFRLAIGKVTLDDSSSSDVNAATFTKNGKSYMIIFYTAQPADVILKLADAA